MDAATIEANRENAKRGVLGLHVVFDPPKQEPGDGVSDRIIEYASPPMPVILSSSWLFA